MATRIASRGEIADGTGKVVELAGKKIAVFNVGGKFYAIDNECKHRKGPLGEGTLDGTTVTCPWHGWEYDVTTGKLLQNPTMGVACYATEVRGEEVFVDIA